jgi:hypothetical protein
MTNKRQTPSGPLLAATLAAGLLVSATAAHSAGAAVEAKPVLFPIRTAGGNTQPA